MKFVHEVEQGGWIPGKHLGLYRRVYDRDTALYMPIPFNVVARWCYNTWLTLRTADTPSLLDEAFERGYTLGAKHRAEERALARQHDFQDGYNLCLQHLLTGKFDQKREATRG